MVNMVATGGGTERSSLTSVGRSASASGCGSVGPCVRFEGIHLELSSFSGCQFDFAKDGNLVLTFDSFSGTVTLRSNGMGDNTIHPLCSTASEAGSLGMLDAESAMDMDMALSQLEQDSPKSGLGIMYSPCEVRQACEGKNRDNETHEDSAAKANRLLSKNITKSSLTTKTNKINKNDVCLSALVSPQIHSKKNASGNNTRSPIAGALQGRPASVAAVTGESATSPARGDTGSDAAATARAGTRAVSPDTPSAYPGDRGAVSSKPKGKRARRTREDTASTLVAGGSKGNGDVEGRASGRKRQARSTATAASGKENQVDASPEHDVTGTVKKSTQAPVSAKKSSPVTKTSVLETPVITAEMEQDEHDELQVADAAAVMSDDALFSQIEDEIAATEEGAARQDNNSRGSSKATDTDADASPAASAADAWISTAPAAPLGRSSKAKVVDTLCEKVGGASDGAGPMGRWGHSATMTKESQMLVLGGQADDDAHQATLGDLYKFDFETYTWSRPMNCDSIPRAWHTASFIAGKNLLVIFGGERTVDGCPECLDDIMVLDTDIDLLYPPAISGKPPTSRSGHSAAIIGTDLIVFGGVRGRKWQNNVAVLDTELWRWRHPTVDGSTPAPRSYHSATVVGNLMVVFGGNNQNESFDRVYVLDTGKPRWEWTCPEIVGAAPAARTGHTALLLPDGFTILIHGGWDPEDEGGVKNFGDAFLLDTKLWEWSRGPEALLGGEPAGLRVGHTAVLAGARVGKALGVSESEMAGWQLAFVGGQDGEGVRGSEVALLSF